jgi:hypothetical protein
MSSMEELKGRIAAGDYAIDSGELAGEILTKFALVRRVTRRLMSEGEPHPSPARGGTPREEFSDRS